MCFESPGTLLNCRLGPSLRVCISNELPGDADGASGPPATLSSEVLAQLFSQILLCIKIPLEVLLAQRLRSPTPRISGSLKVWAGALRICIADQSQVC